MLFANRPAWVKAAAAARRMVPKVVSVKSAAPIRGPIAQASDQADRSSGAER